MNLKASVGACICLLLFVNEVAALECYSYVENSHEGFGKTTATLVKCPEEATFCVTLSWLNILDHAGNVDFKQGLCSTSAVCQSFCAALSADEMLGARTPQCQQQCCTADGCNKPTEMKHHRLQKH